MLGDACDFTCEGLPEEGTVDCVSFSYSLTIRPDWKTAIQNAFRLLKQGGHIAGCDFTINSEEEEEQTSLSEQFFSWLFAHDDVHLSADYIPSLQKAFEEVDLQRGFGSFPYTPFLRAPFYHFIGKKTCLACPVL